MRGVSGRTRGRVAAVLRGAIPEADENAVFSLALDSTTMVGVHLIYSEGVRRRDPQATGTQAVGKGRPFPTGSSSGGKRRIPRSLADTGRVTSHSYAPEQI